MSGSTWTWIGGTINLDSPSDWTLAAGPGNSADIPQTGDTAINNGTLVGYGLIAAALINNGTVEASNNSVPASSTGGELEIQGAVSGTGSMTIAPGATLKIDGALGASQTVAFSPGAPETLSFGSPTGTISNPITGIAAGDAIEFSNGVTVSTAPVVNGSTVAVTYHNAVGSIGVYDFINMSFAAGAPHAFIQFTDFLTGAYYVSPMRQFIWTGNTNTDFSTATNWNDSTDRQNPSLLVPGPVDYVTFQTAGGTISGSGTVYELNFRDIGSWTLAPGTTLTDNHSLLIAQNANTSSNTSVTIGATSMVDSEGFISVGQNAGNVGHLTITGGGVLDQIGPTSTSNAALVIGSGGSSGTLAAANGSVVVTGTGSMINLGLNAISLGGAGGNGAMTVLQGATVVAGALDDTALVALVIGGVNGNGSLTVTDSGSQFIANGAAAVGRAGTGSLIVENQGSVVIGLDGQGAGGLSIGGSETSSTGALYVGGTGTALVNTGGNLFSQADIDVGLEGTTGTLSVQGGSVGATGQLLIGTSITLAPGTTLITPNGNITLATTTVENGTGVVNVGEGGTVQMQGLTEGVGGSIVLTGGSLLDSASGTAAGAISGFGILTGQLTSNGAIVAPGGTLDFTSGLLGDGGITIDGGAALQSDSQLGDSQSVTFATAASTEDLILGAPQATNAFGIANWQYGDEIVFTNGATVTGAQWVGSGTLEVDSSAGTMDFTNVGLAGGTTANFTTGSDFVELVLCFMAGTQIATPTGEVPVERLAVGDKVLTHRGEVRRIVWIGIGKVLATRGRRNAATPVIVRKGALADNVPHHDLRVTKGHAFYVDGVLIPVEFLVNHRSIEWDDRAQEVELYHVELETHDVLVANGAPAESYRDDGNRWLFRNANTGWGLPPLEPCAPVLTGGAVVDEAWRRLLERAGARPGVPLTNDPDLHLLVDGQRVDVAQRHGDRHMFRLRPRPGTVRIVSRAAAPQELGLARDPRVLGVALRRIVASQGARLRVIEADDALLADGFHTFEPDNCFRWTDGDAAIPAELFAGFTGPIGLVLHIGGTARYHADNRVQRVA